MEYPNWDHHALSAYCSSLIHPCAVPGKIYFGEQQPRLDISHGAPTHYIQFLHEATRFFRSFPVKVSTQSARSSNAELMQAVSFDVMSGTSLSVVVTLSHGGTEEDIPRRWDESVFFFGMVSPGSQARLTGPLEVTTPPSPATFQFSIPSTS